MSDPIFNVNSTQQSVTVTGSLNVTGSLRVIGEGTQSNPENPNWPTPPTR